MAGTGGIISGGPGDGHMCSWGPEGVAGQIPKPEAQVLVEYAVRPKFNSPLGKMYGI